MAMSVARHDQADPSPSRSGAVVDQIGKKIIELLQSDGRMPYVSIAAAVGLSEGAVRQRVQRMLDTGVMQIVAVTDPMMIGFSRQAMIGIKTTGDATPVAEALCEIPQVDYVVTTAGRHDLLAEVVCENDAELLDVLMTRIRALPGVVETESYVYLKLNKQHYDWGTR